MTKRTIPITLGIIAVVVVGIILYFVFFNNAGSGTGWMDRIRQPLALSVTVAQAYPNAPTGQYLSLGGVQGGVVQVNNFYTASATAMGDDGILVIKQASNYWFTYDPSDSTFWIAISGTPFGAVRATAEQDFLETLGVSQAGACKLAVSVGVPYSAGNPMDGQSLPLSFCANNL